MRKLLVVILFFLCLPLFTLEVHANEYETEMTDGFVPIDLGKEEVPYSNPEQPDKAVSDGNSAGQDKSAKPSSETSLQQRSTSIQQDLDKGQASRNNEKVSGTTSSETAGKEQQNTAEEGSLKEDETSEGFDSSDPGGSEGITKENPALEEGGVNSADQGAGSEEKMQERSSSEQTTASQSHISNALIIACMLILLLVVLALEWLFLFKNDQRLKGKHRSKRR